MRLAAVALALLAAAITAGAGEKGETLTVRLKVAARSGGRFVRLAEVAGLSGRGAESAGRVLLGESPADGARLALGREEVALRLEEEGFDRRRFSVVGADEVVVSAAAAKKPAGAPRAGKTRNGGDANGSVRQAAVAWVRASLARRLKCDAGVLEVRVTGSVHGDLPAGSLEDLEADVRWPVGRVRLGRQRVRVALRRGERQVGSAEFSVETSARLRVLVAARNIGCEEAITADDVTSSELRLTDLAAEYVVDPGVLRGVCARREIRAGEPLSGRSVKKQSLVRRGQAVTVICRVGEVTAMETGIAKSDGGLGDVIAVERSGGRAPFSARVTGAGEARVD